MQAFAVEPMPNLDPPSYSQEDVHEILKLAIARQAENGTLELSRSQLLEIADEMGISHHEIALAEQEWSVQQRDMSNRMLFEQHRKQRFTNRLSRYLIVNFFLLVFSLLTSGGIVPAVTFLAVGWGLFVALDGWNTFLVKGDRYERAFVKWQRRRMLQRSVNHFFNSFQRWIR
ncbi:2TM domain-containing protein [Leptolyngbya sp. AN02str]|uniref:2TM domain-containing protein n=1 Tax=Leptolyngbya sp. AN02str TaxID=3423363 RepID=UPI003D31E04B